MSLHLYKPASSTLPLAPAPTTTTASGRWQPSAHCDLTVLLQILEGARLISCGQRATSAHPFSWEHRQGRYLRNFYQHPSFPSQSRPLSSSKLLVPNPMALLFTVTLHQPGTLLLPSLDLLITRTFLVILAKLGDTGTSHLSLLSPFSTCLLGCLVVLPDPSTGPKPQGVRLILLCGPHQPDPAGHLHLPHPTLSPAPGLVQGAPGLGTSGS